MSTVVIDGAYIAAGEGTEHSRGHIVAEDGILTRVAAGPAPDIPRARRIDGRGCLATPGLVNTHNHLYQWATQGMFADATLFEWLTGSYALWSALDARTVFETATAGTAWLALSGCTTCSDHHYLFPREPAAMAAAEVEAARAVGIRLHL
ncbi:amidohydrolase family protein, partial [Streptomonospora algeriensis]